MKQAFASIHALRFSFRYTLLQAASGQMNGAAQLNRDSAYHFYSFLNDVIYFNDKYLIISSS